MNDVVLNKMRRFCTYQERSHNEVRSKLLGLKVYGYELEEIISKLIEEDFLNEERYAKAYCTGKYRMNKWGRNKIINGLKRKRISDYCIKVALREIDKEEYFNNMRQLIAGKMRLYKEENVFKLRQKLISFLVSKGYTYQEATTTINEEIE